MNWHPLRAPANGEGGSNGLFGSPGSFPSSSFGASNYWVDPILDDDDARPPSIVTTSPASSVSQVSVSSVITATFSEAVAPNSVGLSVAGPAGPVAGVTSYDSATRTASFTASAPLEPLTTYSATVMSAIDTSGTGARDAVYLDVRDGRRTRHRSDELVDEQRCTTDGSDRRRERSRTRCEVQVHRRWICHGHPLLQGRRKRRRTRRPGVDSSRSDARFRDVRGRERERVAGSSIRHSDPGGRQHDLRRVVSRLARALRGDRRPIQRVGGHPRSAAGRRRLDTRRQRRLPLRR